MNYLANLPKFNIVDKQGLLVALHPNEIQTKFIEEMSGKDVVLKARQLGISTAILAIFALDFLAVENSRSVCISHDKASAQKLFDRVKQFVKAIEEKGVEIGLKYNSRNEMVNATKNSSFYIGTANNDSFGRGDTINNLHLSEFAFYPDPEKLFASVMQAVVPGGRVIIESTANGMNYFKTFWDKSKIGESGFKTHFFSNSYYHPDFLADKKRELGEELFKQEYPSSDLEAFLSSGNPFFDREALTWYLSQVSEPIGEYGGYYDLTI